MPLLEGLATWVFRMEPTIRTVGSQATVLIPFLLVLGVRENTQSGRQTSGVAEYTGLVEMLLILPRQDIPLLLPPLIHRHPTCEAQMLPEVEHQTVPIPLLIFLLIHILARPRHTPAQLLLTQLLL